MVMNLESFGVDGAGYDETETEPPSLTNPPQCRSCFRSLRLYVSCLSAVVVFVPLDFADMI
jgi:hypothetical protein